MFFEKVYIFLKKAYIFFVHRTKGAREQRYLAYNKKGFMHKINEI